MNTSSDIETGVIKRETGDMTRFSEIGIVSPDFHFG